MEKVYLAGKVHPETRERIEKMANDIGHTVSRTLDIVLEDYFSKKNTGEVA